MRPVRRAPAAAQAQPGIAAAPTRPTAVPLVQRNRLTGITTMVIGTIDWMPDRCRTATARRRTRGTCS